MVLNSSARENKRRSGKTASILLIQYLMLYTSFFSLFLYRCKRIGFLPIVTRGRYISIIWSMIEGLPTLHQLGMLLEMKLIYGILNNIGHSFFFFYITQRSSTISAYILTQTTCNILLQFLFLNYADSTILMIFTINVIKREVYTIFNSVWCA